MWQRQHLKQNAKAVLKRFGYWVPFLVSLAVAFLTTDLETVFSGVGPEATENYVSNEVSLIVSIIFLGISVLSLVFTFFVRNPIIIGKNRFYMEHRGFGSKIERLFWSFCGGRYINAVKIMFFRDLKVLLWSLLFIIPGVIKSYEYYMVPYILAENPEISSDRAFELSKKMTDGEKWKIFVLEFSFIGWFLLGLLACGIGSFFVMPYYEATFAELYQVMREKVKSFNLDYGDLPGFFPEQN